MKKRMSKSNKKGFTFVELIVVIAVLAILASIAIPVISTCITSAKMSAMNSDRETLDLLLKTAIIEMKNEIKPTVYNHSVVGPTTNINGVLLENDISDVDFTRKIGTKTYYMLWDGKNLAISENPTHLITASTTLASLAVV